ncbi:MAG: dihydropteroate synthase [Treponema sp. CETP13]|nr:MAG: dihydropteroate synthase [Treponema sp. CETP13]
MLKLELSNKYITTERPAFVMGIVNVTPDSIWEGSRSGADMALKMFEEGADIVDIGGESSRPGSDYVSAQEECERIIPVITEIRKHTDKPISVDTRKLSVMQEARKAGADIVNDISALEDSPELADYCASEKMPIILMHKRGIPVIMQENTEYANPVNEISAYLIGRAKYAIEHGIDAKKIILDTGIGFGKNLDTNIKLIQASQKIIDAIHQAGIPEVQHILMALSRKSCIGEITGKKVEDRMVGTLAANLLAVQYGATMLRVHDVSETIDMLAVLGRI